VTRPALSLDARPRRHPDSAYRPVAEEGGLVVLPGRAEVKVLNPVGIRIYGLLDGTHSVAEIAEAVADEYEVLPGDALADVRSFLDVLEEHGMLAGEGAR
jgi:hypothetical protein